jgi:hypothetical protein
MSAYRRIALCALVLLGLFIAGCTHPTFTRPERTGIEQLLLSTAVDNALAKMTLVELRGEKVFVDDSYLDSYDVNYVKGAIRAKLSDSGVILVGSVDEADVVVEPRCGGLGIDPSKSLLGIPSFPVPVPGVTSTETPELVIYGKEAMDSVTTIAILAYDVNGKQILSTKPVAGTSYFHNYKFLLLIHLNFTDIEAREDY